MLTCYVENYITQHIKGIQMTQSFGKLLLYFCILASPLSVSAFDLTIGTEVIDYSGYTDIYDYSEYNYISDITFADGGCYIAPGVVGTWGHSLSSTFMTVPTDFTVQRALLQITGWAPNGVGGDIVKVQQDYRWTGPTGWILLTDYGDKVFDLTYIDSDRWNNPTLPVEIAQPAHVGVTLTNSLLLVEYGPGAEVPEPATFILFGAGLAGGGALLRRRKRKKA